ncbi:MAG: type II toxin-antitoxin system YafQ family toxin [Candidatus Riflebacteria bacterium]|nr:type II toxin-antitoxin system YafQ family toxin [Candidatus Riflebacteria bacterium]
MIENRCYPSQFKKDYKRVKAQGKDIQTLIKIMDRLQNEETLEPVYRDHALKKNWKGFRECHLSPDWLLVYTVEGDTILFARTGTHSDIFE